MDDNDKKGFAGFDSLLSDVDPDKILNDKEEPSHASASVPASSWSTPEAVESEEGISENNPENINVPKNSVGKKSAQIGLLIFIGFLSLALAATLSSNNDDLERQCAFIRAGTYSEVKRNFSSPSSQLYRCVQEGLIEKRIAQILSSDVQTSDLQNLNPDAFEQGKNLEVYNLWYATQDFFGVKVANTGSQALTDFIFSFQNGSCESNTAAKNIIHIHSQPIQPSETTVLNWPRTLNVDNSACLVFLAGYDANFIQRADFIQILNSLSQKEQVSPEILIPQPASSSAASFDCMQAQSALEILICSNPELASLDRQVGEVYTHARESASENNKLKTTILDDQRQFLKSRLEVCKIPYQPTLSEDETAKVTECLKSLYAERLRDLGPVASTSKNSELLFPPSQAFDPGLTIDNHNFVNQEIGKQTGLLITRVDEAGNQLPINQYTSGGKFIIKFKGKKIYEDVYSASLNFEFFHSIGSEQLVLVSHASGGNSCGATYSLISIISDAATVISDGIGNCAPPQVFRGENNGLDFVFYDGFGKRLRYKYANGTIVKETIILPLHYDPESGAGGYKYFQKYAEKNDLENILIDKKFRPALLNLLDQSIDDLQKRLDLYSINTTSEYIFITGQAAHSGGMDEAFLGVALDGSHIYAAILSTEFVFNEAIQTVKVFSDKPAMYSNPPMTMQVWLNRYKDATMEWKYDE